MTIVNLSLGRSASVEIRVEETIKPLLSDPGNARSMKFNKERDIPTEGRTIP